MATENWNEQIIAEFRANAGHVGGMFENAQMILMHHIGRRSGTEYVAPAQFFSRDDDPGAMFVVASAAGAPRNPQWYVNMTGAGRASVEVGSETFDVDVEDVTGERRDVVFDGVVQRAPGFGDYAAKTAGIRVIPVLALRRR